MNAINRQQAEKIALAGFRHLAGDEDLLLRFCNLTGTTIGELRQTTRQPGFYPAVLDFFIAHEPDLLAWAEADSIDPHHIVAAQQAFEPEGRWDYE